MKKGWNILLFSVYFFAGVCTGTFAQSEGTMLLPSPPRPLKLRHAEPICVDLIRDLGARKGEKEFNFGLAAGSYKYEFLNYGFLEYEFAPLNRLGVEVEIPFVIRSYSKINDASSGTFSPSLKSVKTAMQYTFYVNKPAYLSLAVGYIHEFNLNQTAKYPMSLHTFHPLFIAAKRWGNSIHTMLYVSPVFKPSASDVFKFYQFEVNPSMHYMTSDGKGFAGIEFNLEKSNNVFNIMMRPQIKVRLSKSTAVGFCAGIPLNNGGAGPDMLIRVIVEP